MQPEEEGDGDELVMVPVPKRHLQVVFAALASAMANPPSPGAPQVDDASQTVTVGGARPIGRWTEPKIRALEAELNHEGFPGARRLFAMCAERSPRAVTFADAAQSSGLEDKQLRGELGALTKVAKRLFHGDLSWPVAVRYGEAGEAFYSMDPAIAGWWLAAGGGR
jgi:hypothetical protein